MWERRTKKYGYGYYILILTLFFKMWKLAFHADKVYVNSFFQ
jgi:hypothetical protein